MLEGFGMSQESFAFPFCFSGGLLPPSLYVVFANRCLSFCDHTSQGGVNPLALLAYL